MIEYGFSGGRFAMQNFMKAEILQGKSLNPPLYLQEPLKYTCNTEACPNSVTLYRMRLLQLKDWCALEDYVRTVLQVCITKK